MERWSRWWPYLGGKHVAAQAQQIDLVLHQHALVCGAVGRVADRAAFDQSFMLVNVRALLFEVALVADRIAGGVGAQLLRPESAVWTVAIIALEKPLGHTVMKRPGKLGAHIPMAAIAELRRFGLQEKLALFCMMRRVAVDATHAVHEVRRALVVGMLFGVLVTAEAPRTRLLRRRILERENLCYVAPAVHMFFSRAVARFAAMPFRTLVTVELGFHRGSDMGRGFELVINFFVAGLAGVRANIQRRIGGAYVLLPQVASILSLGGLIFLIFLISGICRYTEDEAGVHRHKNRSSYRFRLPHTAPLCPNCRWRW